MKSFFLSLLGVTARMSPYLLLGFLIAGVLHVYVPRKFYTRFLSRDNKWSVLWAALLGIPLPLCSCGVIPTAVGLKNEKASNGAVASFLIATPQTGIDSILATFSMMGLGFALLRPAAALITGVCGGFLVNRLVPDSDSDEACCQTAAAPRGNRFFRVFRYAYFEMMQDIGARLLVGLIIAALIQVAVPDSFFLSVGSNTLLQMGVILLVAIPMYICSTGSIPVAAALIMKGLSPGAAMVMLMAGPAVNIASVLVVRKSMGARFTTVYLLTIIVFSVLFGLLVNAIGLGATISEHAAHVHGHTAVPGPFGIVCTVLLLILIIYALAMKLFDRFKKAPAAEGTIVYGVEGMHCNHCKAAVEESVHKVKGVSEAVATPAANTLVVKGNAREEDIRKAVEKAGFTFTGAKQ